MKKKKQISVVSKDTLDIIKAIKLMDLIQKDEIIAAIFDLKTKSDD